MSMTHIAKVLDSRTQTLAHFFQHCSTSEGDDMELFVDLVSAYDRIIEENHEGWDEYFEDMKMIRRALKHVNACCCLSDNKDWMYYIGTMQ